MKKALGISKIIMSLLVVGAISFSFSQAEAVSTWDDAKKEVVEAADAVADASKETWEDSKDKSKELWQATKEKSQETADATTEGTVSLWEQAKKKVHDWTAPN